MTVGQKAAVSLLLSVILGAGLVVLSYSGLFEAIETRFFDERVRRQAEESVEGLVASVDAYHESVAGRFSPILDNDFIRRSFLPNQSAEDVFDRTKAFGLLAESTPGFLGVRFIDADARRIHFSTFPGDIVKAEELRVVYRNYGEGKDEPYALVQAPEGASGSVAILPGRRAFAYSFPFVDGFGVYRGSAVFFVSLSGLLERLAADGRIALGDDVVPIGDAGLLFGAPAWAGKELSSRVAELWGSGPNAEPVPVGATEASDTFVLFSRRASRGLVGRLVPASWFDMPEAFRWLLLGAAFVTLFLAIFLGANLRQDRLAVLAGRIKRLQIEMLDEYLERKGDLDVGLWKAELESRRAEAKARIRKSAGRLARRRPADVDALIDRSWDDIIAVMTARGERSSGIDLASIEALLKEALSKGSFVIGSAQRAVAPAVPVEARTDGAPRIQAPLRDSSPSVDDVEEVEELVDELTEAEAVEEVEELVEEAEAVEEVEELAEAEAVEEVEELVEEAEAVEEVEELVEEAEAVEEVEELVEEAEAVEEVEELVEEAEEAEEAEAVEEEAEELTEAEAVEEVEELAEAEAVEEIEELTEAEAVEEVEELAEEAEEADAVEELVEEAEELTEAEAVDEVEAFSEAETAEAVEELSEVEEAEAVEELESAETLLGSGADALEWGSLSAEALALAMGDDDDLPIIPESLGLELVEETDLADIIGYLDVTSCSKPLEVGDALAEPSEPTTTFEDEPAAAMPGLVLDSPFVELDKTVLALSDDRQDSSDSEDALDGLPRTILADTAAAESVGDASLEEAAAAADMEDLLEEVEFDLLLSALDLSGLDGYRDEDGFLELDDEAFVRDSRIVPKEAESDDELGDEISMLSAEQRDRIEELQAPESGDEMVSDVLPLLRYSYEGHRARYHRAPRGTDQGIEELPAVAEAEPLDVLPLDEAADELACEAIVLIDGVYTINRAAVSGARAEDEALKELADSVLDGSRA